MAATAHQRRTVYRTSYIAHRFEDRCPSQPWDFTACLGGSPSDHGNCRKVAWSIGTQVVPGTPLREWLPRPSGKHDSNVSCLFCALSNLLRQSHRRAEVPVLAHDDGGFILSLIGGPHQVQSQADIYSFLLTSGVHPAPVDVNPPVPQIPDLVRPEAVPEQLRRACQRIGHACIEANAGKGTTGLPGSQDVRQLLNVVARPSIGRRRPRGPRPPGRGDRGSGRR